MTPAPARAAAVVVQRKAPQSVKDPVQEAPRPAAAVPEPAAVRWGSAEGATRSAEAEVVVAGLRETPRTSGGRAASRAALRTRTQRSGSAATPDSKPGGVGVQPPRSVTTVQRHSGSRKTTSKRKNHHRAFENQTNST